MAGLESRAGGRPAGAAALLGTLLLLAACGGEGAVPRAEEEAEAPAAELPVSPPSGPVDPVLVARGDSLFTAKGCVACHTFGGGKLVGPDLAGLTERRSFAWTFHMVTNPDSMLRNDSTAKALLAEYFTPMTDVGVTPEQFRALWEHMRAEGSGDR